MHTQKNDFVNDTNYYLGDFFAVDTDVRNSHWTVTKTWTKGLSEYYAYEVRFSKYDTTIILLADSKKADTFIPLALNQIYVQTPNELIGISFSLNYTSNLPEFKPLLKKIDVSKISSISTLTIDNGKLLHCLYSNIPSEKNKFDSMISVLNTYIDN